MKDTPEMIRTEKVLQLIERWRSHYPEDTFPPESPTVECRSAKLVRQVLDGLASDVLNQYFPRGPR